MRLLPDGRYEVRFRFGATERRRRFDFKEEALSYLKEQKERLQAYGRIGIDLTGSQFCRVVAMVHKLAANNPDGDFRISVAVMELERAAQWWPEELIRRRNVGSIQVAEAVELRIADWKKERKDNAYVANAGSVLRRFARHHPGQRIANFTARQLRDWILKQPGCRATLKARLSSLFSFAVFQGWVAANPCFLFRLSKSKSKVVEIPQAAEIEGFMRTAEADARTLIPYFSLRLFSGLRACEARKLRWDHVSFDRKRILVPSGVAAKGGPARDIPASENLLAWLRAYRPVTDQATVAPVEVKKLEADFRKSHGFRGPSWFNVLRHSYGSFRYPLVGNLDAVAEEMGNSRRVLSRHYIGAVTDQDVHIFWAIFPTLGAELDH